MNDKLGKLMMSVVGLLVSLVLIATSTFAWFAISESPEVRGIQVSVSSMEGLLPFQFSLNGESNWTTTVNLSALMKEGNVLRPVTTYNGDDWFFADYDAMGNVTGFELIPKEMYNTYINSENVESNCFVYEDVYVRTISTEAASFSIRLSNPLGISDKQDETQYGTYVVCAPEEKTLTVEEGDSEIRISNDAMAALRVGFQVYNTQKNEDTGELTPEATGTPFYIYEPNADVRSQGIIDMVAADGNAMGEQARYLYEENGDSVITSAKEYAGKYQAETLYDTWAPTVSEDVEDLDGFLLQKVGADTDETILVQQRETTWDNGLVLDGNYDSTNIEKIGDFVKTPPDMTTISTDEVKMIRIYFWLEGQDVDCWNQILGGSVFANLEFTGEAQRVTG